MTSLLSGARPLWLLLFIALAAYACFGADAYAVRLLTMAGIWALMGLGYQLVFGHIGALSLAQGAFFGCGAYAAALAAKSAGMPLPIGLALAALVPALLAAVIALPVLRLETHYFALATLGIAQVVHLLAVNWESLTGGANGLGGVPMPLQPDGLAWAAIVWIAAALAALVITRIVDGLAGPALALMREHPLAASSLGIDLGRWRFGALVAAAALAGLAGGFAAHTAGVVSPEVTDLPIMITCLTLVVVGGRRHAAGALLGAILVVHLPEWFRSLDRFWLVAYGIATLLILIAAPEGIVGTIDRWWRRRQSARAEPLTNVASTRSGTLPADGKEILVARDLGKSFGGVVALDGVSLSLARGEIVGLIGPNGSGKTTLINVLTGIEPPTQGDISLAGRSVAGWQPHRIAALGLARSFQTPQLSAQSSVLDAVAIAQTAERYGARPTAAFADAILARDGDPALRRARSAAREILQQAGLASAAQAMPAALPAGTRRLVEIARALLRRPSVLLLDEPAAGLAAAEQADLQELLRAAAAGGMAILVIEHSLGFLLPLAARVICLDRGRIIAEGAPQELQKDPRLARAFFGVVMVPAGTEAR